MLVMDVVEKDKEYEITAELPGMDEKDVEIKLSNRTLTIKGEKKEEEEEREKDYYLSERRYGSFQRSFQVPEGCRRRKDRGKLRKGRFDGSSSQDGGSQKKREDDHGQGHLIVGRLISRSAQHPQRAFSGWLTALPPLFKCK